MVEVSSPRWDLYIMLNLIALDEQNNVDGDHKVFQNLARKPFHSLHVAVNTAARSIAKGQG
jgi:hypothetical protein